MTSGGFSDTMTVEGGVSCSRDRNTAGYQAGGGQPHRGCTDLLLSFLAFSSHSSLEKNTGMALAGGTGLRGVWLTFEDSGATGC